MFRKLEVKNCGEGNGRQVAVLSIGLFALLTGAYLLAYSGVYHSGDEVGFVRDAVDMIRNKSADPGYGGPFTALLAIAILLTQSVDFIGMLQAVYLVNIATTALAAVFVFLLGVELAYDWRTALLVALLYGLASPAWVYSKLLFRDPFIALMLIAMAYFLIRFRFRRSFVTLGLAVLAGGLAIATRTATAIVAPFVFVYVGACMLGRTDKKIARPRINKFVSFGIFIGLLAIFIFVVTSEFVDYTRWLDRPLGFLSHREELVGLLVSPGRGVLFYAPVLVLALMGLVRFAQRHAWEALLLYGMVPFFVLLNSAYSVWWGGWSWGPRYMVPMLPYLLFPIISLIEPLVTKQWPHWAWIPVVLVILLSFAAQAIGVAVGPNTASFQNMDPSTFSRWQYTPFAQITAANRVAPDVAWLYLGGRIGSGVMAVTASLTVVVLGILLLWLARTTDQIFVVTLTTAFAVAVVTLSVPVWLVHYYSTYDTRYKSPEGFDAAIERVRSEAKSTDILVYDHPVPLDVLHKYPSLVSNFCGMDCPTTEDVTREYWASTPVEDKHAWLEKIRWFYSRVWLVTSYASAVSPEFRVQPWLDTYTYLSLVGCTDVSADVTLCQYENTAFPTPGL